MAPIGTKDHLQECTLRRLQEAAELCQINPVMGLEHYEKILSEDDEIIESIIRRHGHVGGHL